MLLKIAEIAGTVLGTIAFGLLSYWKLRDKRMRRELQISDNPTLCGDHAKRIAEIGRDVENIKEDIRELTDRNREDHQRIFDKLERLELDITRLSRNGGGPNR